MDKTTTVLGALNAGKLPTTAQFDAFVEQLCEKDVGLFAEMKEATAATTTTATGVGVVEEEKSKSNLSLIAKDMRELLDSYRRVLNDKNPDNILQEAIWHLRVVSQVPTTTTTTTETSGTKKDLSKDIQKTRLAILKLLSCLWESFTSQVRSGSGGGGGGVGVEDLFSLLRSTIADVAEVVEERAGVVKEGMRREAEVAAKDSSTKTKEEDATKAEWEAGVERVKKVGSGAIDAKREVQGKVGDVREGGEEMIKDGLVSIWERAQKDPEYKQALDTVFEVLQKRLRSTLDAVVTAASSDPSVDSMTLSSFFEYDDDDEETEGGGDREHILEALGLLCILFERMAGGKSFDGLIEKTKEAATMILDDESLKGWFDDFLTFSRANVGDVEYALSDKGKKERKALRERWSGLLENEGWKRAVEEVKREVREVEEGLKGDEGLKRIGEAQMRLGKDLREVVGEEMMSCWKDFMTVYLPRILSRLKSLPIPRTEYKDEDIEFVLENLDISRLNVFPSHVYIRNITDVDISTAEVEETKTRLGTLTHMQIQAVQLELRDVSFWYKNLKSTIGPNEFTGLLGMKVPPQGINVDLKVRLIPENVTGKHSRESMKAYHVIERAEVHIADEVAIEVKESNHPLLVGVFQPIVRKRVKEALEKTLSGQVRALVEFVDGGIWDVGERRKVFEDAGLSEGAASVAAIWSEIGKIEREAGGGVKLGVTATGTGVIFEGMTERPKKVTGKGPGGMMMEFEEGKEVKEHMLAFGVEPQVLSGEKRGPFGTGSTIEKGKKRLEGFKQAVVRKEQLESNKQGWKSVAFDF